MGQGGTLPEKGSCPFLQPRGWGVAGPAQVSGPDVDGSPLLFHTPTCPGYPRDLAHVGGATLLLPKVLQSRSVLHRRLRPLPAVLPPETVGETTGPTCRPQAYHLVLQAWLPHGHR